MQKGKPKKFTNFKYTVVKFARELEGHKFFECMPDLWFLDETKTTCYFPPPTGRAYKLRAINCEVPGDDWGTCECEVVSEGHLTYLSGFKYVQAKCAQNYNTSSADEELQITTFRRNHPGLVCGRIEDVFANKNKLLNREESDCNPIEVENNQLPSSEKTDGEMDSESRSVDISSKRSGIKRLSISPSTNNRSARSRSPTNSGSTTKSRNKSQNRTLNESQMKSKTTKSLSSSSCGDKLNDQGVVGRDFTSKPNATSNQSRSSPSRSIRSGSNRSGSSRSGSSRSGSSRSGSSRSGSSRSGSNRSASNRSGSNKSGSNRSGSNIPGSKRPGTNRPGSNRSGSNHFRSIHSSKINYNHSQSEQKDNTRRNDYSSNRMKIRKHDTSQKATTLFNSPQSQLIRSSSSETRQCHSRSNTSRSIRSNSKDVRQYVSRSNNLRQSRSRSRTATTDLWCQRSNDKQKHSQQKDMRQSSSNGMDIRKMSTSRREKISELKGKSRSNFREPRFRSRSSRSTSNRPPSTKHTQAVLSDHSQRAASVLQNVSRSNNLRRSRSRSRTATSDLWCQRLNDKQKHSRLQKSLDSFRYSRSNSAHSRSNFREPRFRSRSSRSTSHRPSSTEHTPAVLSGHSERAASVLRRNKQYNDYHFRNDLSGHHSIPNNSVIDLITDVKELTKAVRTNNHLLSESDRRFSRMEVTISKIFTMLGDMNGTTDPIDDNAENDHGFKMPKTPIHSQDELRIVSRKLKDEEFRAVWLNIEKNYCCPTKTSTDTVTMTKYLKRFINLNVRCQLTLKENGDSGITLFGDYHRVYLFLIDVMIDGYRSCKKKISREDAHTALRIVWGRSKQLRKEGMKN